MNSSAVVLVDGGYYAKLRRDLGVEPNLLKLSDALCSPVSRLRTYYYDALPWVSDSAPSREDVERRTRKQKYFEMLNELSRFEVRQGRLQKLPLQCPVCRASLSCPKHHPLDAKFNQKLVDVLLSVDLVRLAWSRQADFLVIVGGDSDFVPAVRAAKDAGAVVKVAYGITNGTRIHGELKQACDERFEITKEFLQALG